MSFSRKEYNLDGSILRIRTEADSYFKYLKQRKATKFTKGWFSTWWVKTLKCQKNLMDSDSFLQRLLQPSASELKFGLTSTMMTQRRYQSIRILLKPCSLKLVMNTQQRQCVLPTWKETRRRRQSPKRIILQSLNEDEAINILIRFCL